MGHSASKHLDLEDLEDSAPKHLDGRDQRDEDRDNETDDKDKRCDMKNTKCIPLRKPRLLSGVSSACAILEEVDEGGFE